MDLSLHEIIDKVDSIHNTVVNMNILTEYIQIKNYMKELKNIEKIIGSIYMKTMNIFNICTNTHNISQMNRNFLCKDSDIIPTNNSWAYLNRMITPNKVHKQLANDLHVPVKIVKSIDEVPNIPLYWVENINQFAVCINGVVLHGNIGNIYNHTNIQKNVPVNQTIICKYGNKCNLLINKKPDSKICKFYHDPVELLEALNNKIINNKIYNTYKLLSRNFINTSWIYTELPCNKKNIMIRHFGSKNTLKHEFDLMKIDNNNVNQIIIDNYKHQTIHDLLVVLGLNQCGLLKEYPDLDIQNSFYDSKNSFSVLAE
jgi:hypothetical protein